VFESVRKSATKIYVPPRPQLALAFGQPIFYGTVIADFAQRPVGYGHGLPFIYAMWILAVAILYLPCRWFMELRNRHRDWPWLSYL
jgi:hypothetical protein